jgi:catechol 2,3-dioxygenase-like lactoylglutathione lyase family enzyme
MAGIKAKTKKKPPPKIESKKPAAGKSRAAAKPAAAKSAVPKSAAPKLPPAPKAAPPRRPATPARPVVAPAKPAAPAPLASTIVFQATPKAHVPPKPLAAGAFALDKLGQVALTATNLDLAIEFYRDILGLKFLSRFDPPGFAFFSLGGGTRLMLSATASQATLYFLVDSLDTAVRELKARGVSFLQPPHRIHRDDAGELGRKGTEEWMTFFRDPSGNVLGLVERRNG